MIRLGNRRYRVEKDWLTPPGNKRFKTISAITTDKKDNVYVLQREDPFIIVYSKEGHLIDQWYNESIKDGHFLSVSDDGKVFVVDRDHHRIVILDRLGNTVKTIGDSESPGIWGAPFNHPTDIAISTNGDLFVSDGYGNACVHHLDHNGVLINSWGGFGSNKGEFTVPHALIIDSKNRILVADRENHRVQIFNQDGHYISEINNIHHPMGLCEDNNCNIYVTDRTPALYLYNSDYEMIGRCKTTGIDGHGVTVDNNGDIYIAEMHIDTVTKFVCIDE